MWSRCIIYLFCFWQSWWAHGISCYQKVIFTEGGCHWRRSWFCRIWINQSWWLRAHICVNFSDKQGRTHAHAAFVMFLWFRRVHCFSGVLFRCWEPNHASWYEERDRVWTCRKSWGQLVSSWCTVTSCLKCNQHTFTVLKGAASRSRAWWNLRGWALCPCHLCRNPVVTWWHQFSPTAWLWLYKLSYIRRVLQEFLEPSGSKFGTEGLQCFFFWKYLVTSSALYGYRVALGAISADSWAHLTFCTKQTFEVNTKMKRTVMDAIPFPLFHQLSKISRLRQNMFCLFLLFQPRFSEYWMPPHAEVSLASLQSSILFRTSMYMRLISSQFSAWPLVPPFTLLCCKFRTSDISAERFRSL